MAFQQHIVAVLLWAGVIVGARWALRQLAIRRFIRRTGGRRPVGIKDTGFLDMKYYKQVQAAGAAGNFTRDLRESFGKFGQTWSTPLGIWTTDLENIRVMFHNIDDWIVGPRSRGWAPLLAKGIFVTDGKEWEHSRALLRPSFKRSQIARVGDIERYAQAVISKIPLDGSTVDASPLFQALTLQTAFDMVFGDYDISTDESRAKFDKDFDFTAEVAAVRGRLGWIFTLSHPWKDRQYVRACHEMHAHLHELLVAAKRQHDAREKNARGRYCLVDDLFQLTDDLEQIRWEIVSILAAGRDTTAVLLSHVVHNLVRQPRVWAKLSEEIARLDGQAPDFEGLQQLKYMKAVINETLRVWPSVPIDAKFASRDTVLPRGGGEDGQSPCLALKGTRVYACITALHRRKDVYGPDAEEFRPERWLEDSFRPGLAYMPFGNGPRICIGQQTALTTAGYMLVRLMQACPDLENRDPRPYKEKLKIVADVANGVLVGRARA